MFNPYVNHAAQQMAEVEGAARNRLRQNILHFPGRLLHRSVNITKLIDKTTRQNLLCGFVALCEPNLDSHKATKPQRTYVTATGAELMEASLIAVADTGVELRHPLFARWLAAWPDRRATFINIDASSRRMTDETLEMMLGLAKGKELWVGPVVDELAFTQRSYGRLPWAEYESWIDLTVEVVGELAGSAWNAETEAAWVWQAERLKVLLTDARVGWDRAMPGHILGELPESVK
jgi:hypothetical protein